MSAPTTLPATAATATVGARVSLRDRYAALPVTGKVAVPVIAPFALAVLLVYAMACLGVGAAAAFYLLAHLP